MSAEHVRRLEQNVVSAAVRLRSEFVFVNGQDMTGNTERLDEALAALSAVKQPVPSASDMDLVSTALAGPGSPKLSADALARAGTWWLRWANRRMVAKGYIPKGGACESHLEYVASHLEART